MENTQTPTRKYVIIGIISTVVLAALITSLWFFVLRNRDDGATNIPKEKIVKEVSGTLLLSMLPKEIKGGMPLTFSVEPKTGVFTPLFQYVKESDGIYIFHTSLSPNHKLYVTGGTPSSVNPKDAANSVGLYKGTFEKSLIGVKEGGPITGFGEQKNSEGKVLRLPVINNEGGILYSTAGEGIQDINFNWEIHYSINGQDSQVASGLSPRWVSSTSFVYLSSKGLRIHDLVKNSDSVIDSIIDKRGKIISMQPNMMMSVSHDGNQIALSNPEEYKIYLFRKDGERYVKNTEFGGFGFWPTFSPDGKVLAVQTVKDLAKLKTDPSPQLVFWDIETKEPELIPTQIDLSNYLNEMLFITEWY